MVKFSRVLISLILIVLSALALLPGFSLAAEGDNPPQLSTIELNPSYPTIEGISGSSFNFEVQLNFISEQAKYFDFKIAGPKGWEIYVTPQYQKDTRIGSIRMDPGMTGGTKINVTANGPSLPPPDPGNYKMTLTATSGNLTASTTLTAVVTARYQMALTPSSQRLNMTGQAGSENIYLVKVQNLGSAPIDKINFSSTKPEGWTIEFKPDKLDSLAAKTDSEIQVTVKPDAKTISGDYMISFTASGTQAASQKIDIRVTVETPSTWGFVGLAIIMVVVAGLVLVFMRFSRR